MILYAPQNIIMTDANNQVLNPNLQKDILWLEKQEGSMNFKFGVIYAK